MGHLTEEPKAKQVLPEVRRTLTESRKKLLLTAIYASVVCTAVTVLAEIAGDSTFAPGVLALITSGTALILSLAVIARQKVKGLFPKLYAALGVAFALWFAAESIWVYYVVVASIDTPFPSIADALWLGGYIPFLYFLFGILKNFLGLTRSLIFPVLGIGAIGFVMLGNVLLSIYQEADLSSQEGVVSYIIGSAYPIADMCVIIPALAAFIQLRKGLLTFTPWVFIVIATIAFIVADIGFAYSTLISEMQEYTWVWNPLYNIAYIAFASSLFWHKAFFTIDEKKQLRLWQEQNR